MDNDNESLSVDSAISNWWLTLANRIQTARESGLTPVLIALSRKMPRLIEWLTQTFLEQHPELPPKEILDACELTTELSIPFRVSRSHDMSKECYILIDDIIIHGTTIKSIASDLEILSGRVPGTRIVCYVSSIFIYQFPVAMPSCVSLEDIEKLQPLDLPTTKAVVSTLASLIRTTNLPLDMEYPILRIRGMGGGHNNDTFIKEIKKHFKDADIVHAYEGYWGNTLTALLERSEDQHAFDFAKIRAFESDNGLALEIFSPYTLPDLLKNLQIELFKEDSYKSLWEIVANPVKDFAISNSYLFDEVYGEALRRNMCRSLIVWANYLLSLSFFISRCFDILPPTVRSAFDVQEDDIKLILGSDDCESITNRIRDIIKDGINDSLNYIPVFDENDWFAPEQFREEYIQCKAKLASHSDCVQAAMSGIFEFQNFSNPLYDKPQHRHDRLFYGETFSSLIKSCSPYFMGKEVEYQINHWIDDQIDNGAVVPKYELYVTDQGNYRWRRFFHAGLNATELCLPETNASVAEN